MMIKRIVSQLTVLAGFVFPLLAFGELPAFLPISDIDDTLKITNSGSYVSLARNGLFGKDTFLGMSELLSALKQGEDGLVYLSSSPRWLNHTSRFHYSLEAVLVDLNGFPSGKFALKTSLFKGGRFNYKTSKLEEIYQETPAPIILFGDNADWEKGHPAIDPDVFDYYIKKYPGRVLRAYIHQVSKNPPALQETLTPYVTAFDIALIEFEEGRISAAQALAVADALLGADSMERVLPKFKRCPVDYSIALGEKALADDKLRNRAAEMKAAVRAYCLNLQTEEELRKMEEEKNSWHSWWALH